MKKDRIPTTGLKDSIEVLLGLWLLASPLALGFFHVIPASISAIGIGTVIFFIAQLGLANQQPWEEWVNFLFALLLIISPWLAGYSSSMAGTLNAVIVGSLLVILTLLSMTEEYAAAKQHRKTTPPPLS